GIGFCCGVDASRTRLSTIWSRLFCQTRHWGLTIRSVRNWRPWRWLMKRQRANTRSVLTCPACGTQSEEEMPLGACVYFHECGGCGKLLKPNKGDCCVFCSFGTVKCPPVQTSNSCCR